MKIIFLCGSLEPGYDGVGDYTRRLVGELIEQGHSAAIVSLNDHFIDQTYAGTQGSGEIEIPVLRLPSVMSSTERFRRTREWIRRLEPDWVSLQYVGFGFQRYGLPWEFIFRLMPLPGNGKLHIMFHELWCGMDEFASWKEKVLGVIQKSFLKILLITLKPKEVFTSILHYANCLDKIKVRSKIVPIFGNIPPGEMGSDNDWNEILAKSIFSLEGKSLLLGFFGTVYCCPGLNQLLQTVADAAEQLGRRLIIISIGLNRSDDLRSLASSISGATYWNMGVLSPMMINRAMNLFDLGVLTSPANRINKSGAGVSLLERGIPVLVSAQDKTYCKQEMEPNGIYQAKRTSDVLRGLARKGALPVKSRLSEVVKAYALLEP